MRSLIVLLVVATTLSIADRGMAQEKSGAKPGAKPAPAKPVVNSATSDLDVIRQAAASYAKAFDEGDAKGVAAHFAPDAEYVDEEGTVTIGRTAIEKNVADTITANPGSKLTIVIDTVRFVGGTLAFEEGAATVTSAKGLATETRYVATHAKSDGKWLLASVRDQAPTTRAHDRELKALEFLVGDWVDEGPDGVTQFSCHHSAKGKFLIRDFNVKIEGHAALNGTQRIGWDPQARKLRTWAFDSEGGFNQGEWHRDGESWVLKASGVTADGETSVSTGIFTPVNDHTMTWQAIDITIGGRRLPDTPQIRIVRRPPTPTKKPVK